MTDKTALFEISIAPTTPGPLDNNDDVLDEVVGWFRQQKDAERRFAETFRQSIDEVVDGARTGRFNIYDDSVDKTEKTYLGTKVEILIRAEFDLPRGDRMDYKVAGHEVDAKWTINKSWPIPREATGHICLLMSADDRKSTFNVGLVRVREELLNNGKNQDGKRTLNALGRQQVRWLFRDAPLSPNQLLLLDEAARKEIFAPRSGQQRACALLRHMRGLLINRNTAQTVVSQLDGMKRYRDARTPLRAEGIAVLGHLKGDRRIASALELPVPTKGTLLSVRLVRVPESTTDRPTVVIAGERFSASDSDERTAQLPPI